MSTDIDAILDYGDKLFRNSQIPRNNKKLTIRPTDINSTVYMNLHKFSVSVSRINAIEIPCIIFGPNYTFALWDFGEKEKGIFAFNPDCTDLNGKPCKMGQACAMKIFNVDFLTKFYDFKLEESEIYNFHMLNVLYVNPYPEMALKVKAEDLVKLPSVESIQIEAPEEIDYTFHPELLKRPERTTFNSCYKDCGTHGILRGTKFYHKNFDDIAEATLVMLSNIRARKWNLHFFDEMEHLASFDSGKEPRIVPFRGNMFQIVKENVVFGQLSTVNNPNIATLRQALEKFFVDHDAGILYGPQLVAIWSEFGYFFYFDPKERDEIGQKYLQNDRDSKFGVACVLYFTNLDQFVECYMKNVPNKNKRDLFRIARVDIQRFMFLGDKWNNFEPLMFGKWILRARIPKIIDTICASIIATAFLTLESIERWTPKTLDQIIDVTDEYHQISILRLKFNNKFTTNDLKLEDIIDPKLKVRDQIFTLTISNETFKGHLAETGALLTDLQNFFEHHSTGILTTDFSIAIFRINEFIFLYDPSLRDSQGKNLKTKTNKSETHGLSCVLRFKDLSEASSFIVGNNLDVLAYKLTPITVEIKGQVEKPNLFAYSDFLDYKYAGIIRCNQFETEQPKILLNCLASLGMNELLPAIQWTESNIKEIFTIGEEMFRNSAEHSKIDQKECIIGSNRIKFTDTTKKCIFEDKKLEEETLVEIKTLNEFTGEGSGESGEGGDDAGGGGSGDDDKKKEEEIVIDTLLMCLANVGYAVLESALFTLAIWKQGEEYFMFDVDETREDGTFTPRRHNAAMLNSYLAMRKEKIDEIREQQKEKFDESLYDIHELELMRYAVPQRVLAEMSLEADNKSNLNGGKLHRFLL